MGEGELKQAKNAIKMMRQRARELGEQPVAQAAARALSTGCAAIQTPSNAFGFLLYGAAAVSYDELGLACERETYDAAAARELRRALASLQSACYCRRGKSCEDQLELLKGAGIGRREKPHRKTGGAELL